MGEPSLSHKVFYGVFGGIICSRSYRRSLSNFVTSLELKDNSRILDVGCGLGTVSFALHRKLPYSSILAFDRSRSQIKRATRYKNRFGLNRIDFYVGDIDNFPNLRSLEKKVWAKEEDYDYIFTSGVLEHVNLDSTVKKFACYLKDDGTFINIGVREALTGKLMSLPLDFKVYSEEEIMKAYLAAGLNYTRKITVEDKMLKKFRVAITGRRSNIA